MPFSCEIPSLAILDKLPALVYLSDNVTKTILWCNPYMEEVTGYTLDEIRNMGIEFFHTVMHPQSFPKAIEAQARFKQAGEEFAGACRIRARNSEDWMWLYGIAVPFTYDDSGNVKEVVCCFMELKGADTPVQVLRAFFSLFQAQIKEPMDNLGKREKEILHHVLNGKQDAEIAGELFLSKDTIKTHKKNIRKKLGSENYDLLVDLYRISEGDEISDT